MFSHRTLGLSLVVAALGFAVIQLVPYGHSRTNPPDGALAAFDSPATQKMAERACYDCHSNRTRWPWYSAIAPVSWRIQNHVSEGREKLNFTAFDPANEEVADAAGEASESVLKGEMPPADYLLLHPEARLTASEKKALAAGLDATFAAFGEAGEQGEGAGARAGGEAREHDEAGGRERGETAEREEAKEDESRGGNRN